jgi:hypothetical protein
MCARTQRASSKTERPVEQIELIDADLEAVTAGKDGSGSGFGAKLGAALWAGSGFNPKNNEWWRTSQPVIL